MAKEYKDIKFDADLVELVLSGSKNITWRYKDDKDIKVGDTLRLLKRPVLKPFAFATVQAVTEKPFGEFTSKELDGHETYLSVEEMYQTYTAYYKTAIDASSIMKVVHFILTERI